MNRQLATLFIALTSIYSPASSVFSHEGHGLAGAHWHASDAWGFVVVAALVAVTLWLGRGGK